MMSRGDQPKKFRPHKDRKKGGDVEFSKEADDNVVSKFRGIKPWVVGGAIILMMAIFVAALMNNQNRILPDVTISRQQNASVFPIFRDAVMPHTFRGVCENCHIVKPDIPISATAQMPHQYRGVCSNCHVILGVPGGA